MKTLLEKAKEILLDSAYNLYQLRKDDLDLDELSFENHFRNLGSIVFQIECYQSFGDIISAIEKGDLNSIGYMSEDDYIIEEFIAAISANR